jgi:hypothetical protein
MNVPRIETREAHSRAPTSTILRDLLRDAPAETVTLGWLMGGLGNRSFGIVLLLLGLLAALPGASVIAGLVIMVLAGQMLLARRAPVLPRFVTGIRFRTERLGRMLGRAVPPLRFLERFIRPRWQTPPETTKRVVGAAILLTGMLLFAPIPLSNVLPGLAIALMSLAYLEEDGALLCVALAIAAILLLTGAGAIWQALSAAGWV